MTRSTKKMETARTQCDAPQPETRRPHPVKVTPVRVSMGCRLRLIGLLLRENGILWTLVCLVYSVVRYGLHYDAIPLQRIMRSLEQRWRLPGMNGVAISRQIWDHWDWTTRGHEWTDTPEWQNAMTKDVLQRYVPAGKDLLEIGPGAGRWTEWLQPKARTLTLVDLSESCLAVCRKRFSGCANMVFRTTEGASLQEVPDASIDFIWSFDVFVHITPWDTEAYLSDMARVLRVGGRAVIHHAKDGGLHGAWRSRVTAGMFREMAIRQGLRVITQFDALAEGRIPLSPHHDMITVIEK